MTTLNWNNVLDFANNGNPAPEKKIEKTNQQWAELLTEEQYRITRQKGTEKAHTGELCSRHDEGVYACVCCDSLLFDSTIKYDSGSGWPSFTQPIIVNAISYELDEALARTRVEVLCNVCDAHLGHVFPDGPQPSGLRYCINSAAIKLDL